MSNTELFEKIKNALLEMEADRTAALVGEAIKAGVPAQHVLDKALVKAMQEVGRRFGDGEIFLPELLMSGEAMKAAMKVLEPWLERQSGGIRYRGHVVIGTVQGDVHDIGKNIVAMMLRGNGWEVTDLGVDVPPQAFCDAVNEGKYNVVGLSALLTTTMAKMGETIEALKKAGLRDRVKVAIGGCVVTPEFASGIGADLWATDAAQAVSEFSRLAA